MKTCQDVVLPARFLKRIADEEILDMDNPRAFWHRHAWRSPVVIAIWAGCEPEVLATILDAGANKDGPGGPYCAGEKKNDKVDISTPSA